VLFRSQQPERAGLELNVSSAALQRPTSPRIKSEMIIALNRLGYKAPDYRPRKLTPQDITESDLILCFDQQQKETLEEIANKPIQTLPEYVSWMPRDIKEPAHYLRTPAKPSVFIPLICLLTNTKDSTLFENVLDVYQKTAEKIERHVDKLIIRLLKERTKSVQHPQSGNTQACSTAKH
jgi:protein-tyrosine-phosphatase